MTNRVQVYLVERYHERGALGPEEVQALDRLRLQAVHEVHDKDSDVAQRAPPRSQVGEGLVTRGVNHQHSRQLNVDLHCLVELGHL